MSVDHTRFGSSSQNLRQFRNSVSNCPTSSNQYYLRSGNRPAAQQWSAAKLAWIAKPEALPLRGPRTILLFYTSLLLLPERQTQWPKQRWGRNSANYSKCRSLTVSQSYAFSSPALQRIPGLMPTQSNQAPMSIAGNGNKSAPKDLKN